MNIRISLTLFFFSVISPFSFAAAAPVSLGDINSVARAQSLPFYAQSGDRIFFARTTPEHGAELWVTDGTVAGTQLLKDIVPGGEGSQPIGFAAATINGQPGAYFLADTPANGRELWVTDGTNAGTVLVKDILPGAASGLGEDGFSGPPLIPFLGLYVFFVADDGVNGRELWISDGTAVGTNMVQDINPGAPSSDPEGLFVVANLLIFSAESAATGREPYISNGGLAVILADIRPGGGSSNPANFAATDTRVLFSADDGVNGEELWQTDLINPPSLVSDLTPGPEDSTLGAFNRISPTQVLFSQVFEGPNNQAFTDLSVSDGTPGGTSSFTQLPCVSTEQLLFGPAFKSSKLINNRLVFSCANLDTVELEPWVSDGTPAGTMQLKDIFPGVGSSQTFGFIRGNGRLFFPADNSKNGTEPWVTDGTSAGTQLLVDLNPGEASSVEPFAVFLSFLSSAAEDSTKFLFPAVVNQRSTVYFSDGTLENTRELFDDGDEGTRDSEPREFFKVGKEVLFAATDTKRNREIFTTRGKKKGTKLLKNINKHGSSEPLNFVKFGKGKALFAATDSKRGREPWITDGTKKGTKLLKDIIPGQMGSSPNFFDVRLKKKALFYADNGSNGGELWITNGIRKGTKLLKDIAVGEESSQIANMVQLGKLAVFRADTLANGRELWVTDGTEAGTVLLADIYPGSDSSYPSELEVFGSRAIFSAYEPAMGTELYITDGTTAGTMLLKDINPGATGSSPNGFAATESFVFFSASDPINGAELWRTDGTPGGTVLVSDIRPGAVGSSPFYITPLPGDRVVFSADDGVNGRELWLADGSPGSAVLLKDIMVGADGSLPQNLYAVIKRGLVYFQARTLGEGTELWMTNGTPEGTVLVADIEPGSGNSFPRAFYAKGKKLFFSATTAALGEEPYAIQIP